MKKFSSYKEALAEEAILHLVDSPGDFAVLCLPGPSGKREIQLFTQENEMHVDNTETSRFVAVPYSEEKPNTGAELQPDAYAAVIHAALDGMHTGVLRKVVVSRQKKLKRSYSLEEWNKVYLKLCHAYPNTCTYWFRQGEEMWMGATPELLLKKEEQRWQTVALAGTQQTRAGVSPDTFEWGEKEIVEQQLVTDYILSTLATQGATDVQTHGPFTSPAGGVVHLKTEISFRFDGNPARLAHSLHPTPAICGLPVDVARCFIARNEPQPRSYYTGYLGIFHENGDTDLFVNLRCMRIIQDEVTLFAGGGIVPGSIAGLEWEETERKMDVLLRHL